MIRCLRAIFGGTYCALRMHFWLWREKRLLARLQGLSLSLGTDQLLYWRDIRRSPSAGEPRYIAEVAEQLRLQPLLFGDGKNFLKAMCGAMPPDDQPLTYQSARRTFAEREAKLIAEYDAHFLASIRIKSFVPRLVP